MSLIDFPILYIPSPDKGRPLFNGQVFVGNPDLDPEIPANQKQLRVVEEDGTLVDVPQPFILSAGGVPILNGSTVRLDVDGNFAIKILDKFGSQKYFIENVYEGQPVTSDQVDIKYDTLAEAIADPDRVVDDSARVKEIATGKGTIWDYVLLSSIIPNGDNKFASTGVPSLGLLRRDSQVVAKNINDYAAVGANIAGAISLVHPAGSIGTAFTSCPVEADSFYQVFVDITTNAGEEGFVKILFDGQEVIFGDQSNGFFFSDATILNDGTENNRFVTDNEYYFPLQTSSTSFSVLTIQTSIEWGGTISTIEVREVTPTEKSYQLLSTDGEARDNNVGLGTTGVFRGDIFLGDKSTGGTMSFDGLSPTPAFNVAVGSRALAANFKGDENTGLGTFTLQGNEGSNNVATGYSALKINNKGQENSSFGYKSGIRNTTGFKNSYFGFFAGAGVQTGRENCHFGWHPNIEGGEGSFNSFYGSRAGSGILLGERNIAIGSLATITLTQQALLLLDETVAVGSETKPFGDTAVTVGYQSKVGTEGTLARGGVALGPFSNTVLDKGISIGFQASAQTIGGVAIGNIALNTGLLGVSIGDRADSAGDNSVSIGELSSSSGEQSTVVGSKSTPTGDHATSIGFRGGNNYTGTANTFVGHDAGFQEIKVFDNCTLLGSQTITTASNQVQLGNAATTTFAYGAVQNRSDERDKLEIKDLTDAHIDFFMAVEWKQYRMDYRESYNEIEEYIDEDDKYYDEDDVNYDEENKLKIKVKSRTIRHQQDGSKSGSRFHIGAVAQQVEVAMNASEIDFAGLQHHSVGGGEDIYSMGYQEFIGIQGLIIQKQQARLKAIEDRLDAAGV